MPPVKLSLAQTCQKHLLSQISSLACYSLGLHLEGSPEGLQNLLCCSEEDAFKNSVECITGPVSRIISTQGMPAVYEALDAEGKKVFERVSSPWTILITLKENRAVWASRLLHGITAERPKNFGQIFWIARSRQDSSADCPALRTNNEHWLPAGLLCIHWTCQGRLCGDLR